MEAELQSAVAEYRTQLASLEPLLAVEPGNEDLKEVYEQLQEALSYTLAALDEQQQGAAAAAGEQLPAAEGGAACDSVGGDGGGGGGDGSGGGAGGDAPAASVDVDNSRPPAIPCSELEASSRPRGGARNNARMHPSNLYYRQEPDFAALAHEYDILRPYVTTDAAGRGHLDNTNWEATRALTAVLLQHDFGLKWWLPEGQLVPPVPNRANYIHWIGDLLDLSPPARSQGCIRGLDIGCGANFIYCLLGAVLYGWHMVGIDVTQVAVRCSQQLIQDNPQVASLLEVRDLSYLHPELRGPDAAAPAAGLGGSGRRRKRSAPQGQALHSADRGDTGWEVPEGETMAADGGVDAPGGAVGALAEEEDEAGHEEAEVTEGALKGGNEQGILLPAFLCEEEMFAFTICNPPFFESMQEAAQNPNTAFGGTAAEMVCPGGELAFVLQMMVESEMLKDQVHWFTTMVGKKTTFKALRRELHSRNVTALRTTELAQGKTSRWAVAWSWQVHPNMASQPLRRREAPDGGHAAAAEEPCVAAAAPHVASLAAGNSKAGSVIGRPSAPLGISLLPRRHISFTVQQAGSLNSRTILQMVKQVLQEKGSGPLDVDAATWTVAWPLQVGTFSGNAEDRGLKRPRGDAPEGNGSWASNIKVRLRIAQQQRGRFELVATIPNDAPDLAARAFTGLMAALKSVLENVAS
ncbi:hypothetical protein Vretimale_10821 [Volvox reticuliferus]|uniref:U6 small nuclear RNA (adenine-(43)-N(6))-methyltransferase n=1 Tax=Volvox reticuliferus TaxID=1737510 RepID=A0A8J4GGN3_9CHLO|nr:hypothetical protein Vretifemale_13776 [Volvox reticuliferus]GIM06520.1 hypothetical protein Vretimale_10821 [Volvox reticuliferus]